jgi:RimJ/RimL family protein N-acetyltransferase
MKLDRQPVLDGELVRLRPLQESDFDALYPIASDPLLWEQHPSKGRTHKPVFSEWFDLAMGSGGALAVLDRRDDRAIGSSRFDRFDPIGSEVEIGWTFLARSHWGGPYNGETKHLMLRHAFRSVDAVVPRSLPQLPIAARRGEARRGTRRDRGRSARARREPRVPSWATGLRQLDERRNWCP